MSETEAKYSTDEEYPTTEDLKRFLIEVKTDLLDLAEQMDPKEAMVLKNLVKKVTRFGDKVFQVKE